MAACSYTRSARRYNRRGRRRPSRGGSMPGTPAATSYPKSGSRSHWTSPRRAASSTETTRAAEISSEPVSPSGPPTRPAFSRNLASPSLATAGSTPSPTARTATNGASSCGTPSPAGAETPPRSATSAAQGCEASVDVALGGRRIAVRLARDEHGALELRDELTGLLVHPGVDLDDAAVRLGLRRPHLEHLRLAEQRVAVEDRVGVAELLGREVRDRLAGHVAHRHAHRERVDERAHHHVFSLLRLRRVVVVDVKRVVVHRDQAEHVIVGLGHGLRGPVLVGGTHLELLQVAPVLARAGRLAAGLVGDQLPLVAHAARDGNGVSAPGAAGSETRIARSP